MRLRNSVLPATATSQEAVLRSRHPPSKRMPSSVGVISPAAWTSSLTNSARSGPLNRSELPPSRRCRRPGVTNRRTRSISSGSVLAWRMAASLPGKDPTASGLPQGPE